MKQILSAVLVSTALLTSSFAYCNDAKPVRISTKEISINSPFQKITLNCNIQLVLIQDEDKSSAVITGDENFIPAVNVSVEKGVLSITSKQNLKGKKIKVFVPVSNLNLLDLAGNGSVATEGIIKLNDLKVIVHSGSIAALHIIGNLQIEPADGCDLEYQKYKESTVVYVSNN